MKEKRKMSERKIRRGRMRYKRKKNRRMRKKENERNS